MDMFTLYIDLSYFVTNQVFVVFIVYHCIIFFAPGLFKYEYRFIKSIFFISSFCFLVSFVIFIYIVLPKFWDFFLSFQGHQSFQKVNVFFEAQINEYFNFYSKFYYFVISIGQIFSFITVYLNLMQFDCFQISKIRKTCYCVFFFFATIMTPPEVISQLITGVGFILIYEGIVFLILLKGSKKFLNNYNYFKLYVNKI
jgi:sec-independent protein translocase protein TatC